MLKLNLHNRKDMDVMKAKNVVFSLITAGLAGLGLYKALGGGKIEKYSSKWFDTVSNEVLNAEREVVRKEFCASGNNFSKAVRLENLLRLFDKVISSRAWDGKTPQAPSYPREHGHNLYKPD